MQPLSGNTQSLIEVSGARLAVIDVGQLLGNASGVVILTVTKPANSRAPSKTSDYLPSVTIYQVSR